MLLAHAISLAHSEVERAGKRHPKTKQFTAADKAADDWTPVTAPPAAPATAAVASPPDEDCGCDAPLKK
jgi:hypothetical protein